MFVYLELNVNPKVRNKTERLLAFVVPICLEMEPEVGFGVSHLLNSRYPARSKYDPKSGLAFGVCST